ncbi:hypothetical protein MF6394_29885 [Pseudomonas sp. MF6394]|nr:hypothetical protein BFC21_05050 [Pseudomonas sp. TMW 2.1634]OOV90665.1 hypothetical protein MF6394_29885 [Pseudomonas sp. MF6394]
MLINITGIDRVQRRIRFDDMIREAVRADELGFYCWGTSEAHFIDGPTISAPDALYGAVAALTKDIIIRYMAVTIPFHNPITVAERLATLDILSKGRAELCTARGNNKLVMQAFGVKPSETRDRWKEAITIIGQALTKGVVSNSDGQYWPFEEVKVNPRALQKPSPHLFSVSSGPESHKLAAEYGVGILTFDNFFGWDYVDECIGAYRDSIGSAKPVNGQVNNSYGYYVPIVHCAKDRATAMAEVRMRAYGYVQFILDIYLPLAKESSYEYFGGIQKIEEYKRNLEKLIELSPSIMVGTPDDIIESLKALERRGVDEVILTVDAMTHEQHMQTLNLLGEHVLPHFHKN